VGAQCGDQDRHRAIADEFAEAAFGFEHLRAPAAVQWRTMMPFCQRFTRRPISRARPTRFSIRLVDDSTRSRFSGRPRRITVSMIRKGQSRRVSDNDVRQQNRFIDRLFDLAA